MATRTENKYGKLDKTNSERNTQIVYPADLTNLADNPGHVVVFEINNVVNHKSSQYEDSLIVTDASNTIPGSYGSEVSMQTATGGSSVRGKGKFASSAYKKSNLSIVLPMPDQINMTQVENWQTTELGAIGRANDLINSLKDSNWGIAGDQVLTGMARTAAGAVQALGISNAKDALEIGTSTQQNPYQEVLFKGAGNRTIPFVYTFTPRSLEEALLVRALIHRFRWAAAPEFKFTQNDKDKDLNTSFLIAPSTFDISFVDLNLQDRNQWMWKVSTCALTNISVNGTPNGEYMVTRDGAFASCQLELQFLELIIHGKENMPSPDDTF